MKYWADMSKEERFQAVRQCYLDRMPRREIQRLLHVRKSSLDKFCSDHRLTAMNVRRKDAPKSAEISRGPMWDKPDAERRRMTAYRAAKAAKEQRLANFAIGNGGKNG
jgi:hypothetical protein